MPIADGVAPVSGEPLPDQAISDAEPPIPIKVKEEPPDSPKGESKETSCCLDEIKAAWQERTKVKQEKGTNHVKGRVPGCTNPVGQWCFLVWFLFFVDWDLSATDMYLFF